MKLNKEILITLAVIILTAFNIWRVEIEIPAPNPTNDPLDIAYKHYIYSQHYMLCAYVIGLMVCWFTGVINRVIRSCLIVNAGLFAIIIAKLMLGIPNKSAHLDWTLLGVVMIASFYYLIHNHIKYIVTFVKNLTNYIHMRWPNKKKKHGRSE